MDKINLILMLITIQLIIAFGTLHGIAFTDTGLYIDVKGKYYDIYKHIECNWIQIDCNE